MQRSTRYLLITITAVFLLLTIIKSFSITKQYGGGDLRTRIVGARLLSTGQSPYFYKWKPGTDVFYLDPNDEAYRLVNGNVVTPAALAIIYPMAQLPYPQVRLLWTILQLIAAGGILLILFRNRSIGRGFLVASPIILGFICSELWFNNIERGQMYIFYAFLFTAMYGVYTSKWKYNEFLSGFIGGLFILFRPFAGIIGLGFLLHGKFKWVLGCIAGFLTGCLLFVLPFIPQWKDYSRAMEEYVNENTGQSHHTNTAAGPLKPAIIEGADNLQVVKSFALNRLDTMNHTMKRFGIDINSTQSVLLYILIMAVLSALFFRLRKKMTGPEPLFLFGFLGLVLAELFVLAPRGPYNLIQWIFPVSVIYLQARKHLPSLVILITGLLLLHNFPYPFFLPGQLSELLFIALSAYYIFFPLQIKKQQDGISGIG